MLADERQQQIVETVDQHGTISTADLIEMFGVSPITIRRDLNELAERGRIVKVHGGARSAQVNNNPAFDVKANTNHAAKTAIAREIAGLVRDGESLMISAGTTSAAVARELNAKRDLTVITNSARVAQEFSPESAADIYLTGGRRAPNDALVGPVATSAVACLNASTLITSVHAADAAGLTTPSVEEADTLTAMLGAVERVIVGFDHSKWGVRALATFARWPQVDVVVVDADFPAEALDELKNLVQKVVVAS